MKDIDLKRIAIFSINLIASLLFSYFLTSTLTNNTDALNLVANVFSILSGFLLLVITMSGDNSTFSAGLSNLDIENQESRFLMRFNKYYTLFLLYLGTLILIFIYYLLAKDTVHSGTIFDVLKSSIAHTISFFTCFSFIQSTFIPIKIKELFNEKRELNKKN